MKALLIGLALATLQGTEQPAVELTLDPLLTDGPTIELKRIDGVNHCTLIFEDMSLRAVLNEITSQLGIELEGFNGVERNVLVTADLRERSLRESLEYLLGSVGLRYTLRTTALTVLENDDSEVPRAQLLQLASAAYFRAQKRFPGHELAPQARLNQGRIERERKNWVGALEHYQEVRENYATSNKIPEAIYFAGLMHLMLSEWSEASLTFRELINMQDEDEFRVEGMKGFTRSLIELRDEDTALHTLDIINKSYPATNSIDRRERLFLRADALAGVDDYINCLRILEKLQSSALSVVELLKVHELRARSFEGLDMPSEAGRSWLLFAQGAVGDEKQAALITASRLALDAGDELAVLFIGSTVETEELREAIAPFMREANVRMGLSNLGSLDSLNAEERITLAERHIGVQRYDDAELALSDVLTEREELPNNLRYRFSLAWTSVLENSGTYREAIEFLSSERPFIDKLDDRRQLDIRAADIYERNGFPEKGIAAFGGNY